MWLEAIARDTQIAVPQILRATDRSTVVTGHAPGVTSPRYVTVMSWLSGVPMEQHLSERNLEKLGELFAALHVQGAKWNPPGDFTIRRFDRIFSRDEPDIIFHADQRNAFTKQTLAIVHQTRELVDAAYTALDPADLRVIHNDLWHGNIKIHKGVLQPYDFEDTVWGYRLHDIAMAMLDLYEAGNQQHYEHLLVAFRRGYERRLDWPDGDMSALQVGRILWRMNWIARFQRQHLADNVAFYVEHFERYLETGRFLPLKRSY